MLTSSSSSSARNCSMSAVDGAVLPEVVLSFDAADDLSSPCLLTQINQSINLHVWLGACFHTLSLPNRLKLDSLMHDPNILDLSTS